MSLNDNPHNSQMASIELERRFLGALHTFVKSCVLYGFKHPATDQYCHQLLTLLQDIFKKRIEFAFGQINGMFIIEDQPLIEESLRYYELLRKLEELNIARMTFLAGVTAEELMKLSGLLIDPPPKSKDALPAAHEAWPHIRMAIQEETDFVATEIEARRTRIKRVQEIYEEWQKLTEEAFTKLLEEQSFSLSQMTLPMDVLIDELDRDPAIFATHVAQAPVSSFPVQHAIHTMIFSIHVGQKLGLDSSTLKSLGVSALLHDVGRFFLPSDIDLMPIHCQDGASFLAGVAGLPTMVVRAALEHHMDYDGGGYPQWASHHKPHILSQIIGLADFISWGTISDRAYHRPVALHRLIRSVLKRAGTQFNPVLVKLLIPLFGWYPPGTQVRLENGEEALALEPNLRNILRPGVVPLTSSKESQWRWLASIADTPGSPFAHSIQTVIKSERIGTDFLNLVPDIKPQTKEQK